MVLHFQQMLFCQGSSLLGFCFRMTKQREWKCTCTNELVWEPGEAFSPVGASYTSPLLLLLAAPAPQKSEVSTNALNAEFLEALILFFFFCQKLFYQCNWNNKLKEKRNNFHWWNEINYFSVAEKYFFFLQKSQGLKWAIHEKEVLPTNVSFNLMAGLLLIFGREN